MLKISFSPSKAQQNQFKNQNKMKEESVEAPSFLDTTEQKNILLASMLRSGLSNKSRDKIQEFCINELRAISRIVSASGNQTLAMEKLSPNLSTSVKELGIDKSHADNLISLFTNRNSGFFGEKIVNRTAAKYVEVMRQILAALDKSMFSEKLNEIEQKNINLIRTESKESYIQNVKNIITNDTLTIYLGRLGGTMGNFQNVNINMLPENNYMESSEEKDKPQQVQLKLLNKEIINGKYSNPSEIKAPRWPNSPEMYPNNFGKNDGLDSVPQEMQAFLTQHNHSITDKIKKSVKIQSVFPQQFVKKLLADSYEKKFNFPNGFNCRPLPLMNYASPEHKNTLATEYDKKQFKQFGFKSEEEFTSILERPVHEIFSGISHIANVPQIWAYDEQTQKFACPVPDKIDDLAWINVTSVTGVELRNNYGKIDDKLIGDSLKIAAERWTSLAISAPSPLLTPVGTGAFLGDEGPTNQEVYTKQIYVGMANAISKKITRLESFPEENSSNIHNVIHITCSKDMFNEIISRIDSTLQPKIFQYLKLVAGDAFVIAAKSGCSVISGADPQWMIWGEGTPGCAWEAHSLADGTSDEGVGLRSAGRFSFATFDPNQVSIESLYF